MPPIQFFARLLVSEGLADLSPERGRFRTFRLAALTHGLANAWDRTNRFKRGGGKSIVSLDELRLRGTAGSPRRRLGESGAFREYVQVSRLGLRRAERRPCAEAQSLSA